MDELDAEEAASSTGERVKLPTPTHFVVDEDEEDLMGDDDEEEDVDPDAAAQAEDAALASAFKRDVQFDKAVDAELQKGLDEDKTLIAKGDKGDMYVLVASEPLGRGSTYRYLLFCRFAEEQRYVDAAETTRALTCVR